MVIIDPDKIVEKAKAAHPATYQSSKHPEHFHNEGGEYDENLQAQNFSEAEDFEYRNVDFQNTENNTLKQKVGKKEQSSPTEHKKC